MSTSNDGKFCLYHIAGIKIKTAHVNHINFRQNTHIQTWRWPVCVSVYNSVVCIYNRPVAFWPIRDLICLLGLYWVPILWPPCVELICIWLCVCRLPFWELSVVQYTLDPLWLRVCSSRREDLSARTCSTTHSILSSQGAPTPGSCACHGVAYHWS